MNDKLKNAARWVKTNRYGVALGAMYGTIGVAFVGLIYAAYKDAAAQTEAYNKAVQEYQTDQIKMEAQLVKEFNAGNLVFALENGTYLSVPKETNPKLVTW